MFTYERRFELPQLPGTGDAWEEGGLLWFFDPVAAVGAVTWIQHSPNAGHVLGWCGVVAGNGERFRINRLLPLRAEDRANILGVGPTLLLRPEEDRIRLHLQEPDCSMDVEFIDLFTPVAQFSSDDLPPTLAEQFPVRFETAGRVRGVVRLGTHAYTINGLGFRDRGWGSPNWNLVTNHRWMFGTVGPQLSFSAVNVQNADGSLIRVGYVVRDGVMTRANGVDIVTHMEVDGITHRGGVATLDLPEGPLTVHCTVTDGVLFELLPKPLFWTLETFGEAQIGQWRGVANLEMINNPRRGMEVPSLALRAAMRDGLSKR